MHEWLNNQRSKYLEEGVDEELHKQINRYLKEGLRMLRPASTCPNVKRLLLMEPVSFSAASPSFPVACDTIM